MKCSLCKKRDAVIFFEQATANSPRKLCLCENCAISRGIITAPPAPDPEKIDAIFDEIKNNSKMAKIAAKKICPVCGRSLLEVKETGRVGCQYCYDTFIKSGDITLEKAGPDDDNSFPIPKENLTKVLNNLSKINIQDDESDSKDIDFKDILSKIVEDTDDAIPKEFDDAIANSPFCNDTAEEDACVVEDKSDDDESDNSNNLDEIKRLQTLMDEAVRAEKYEDASKYRDQLNALKEAAMEDFPF